MGKEKKFDFSTLLVKCALSHLSLSPPFSCSSSSSSCRFLFHFSLRPIAPNQYLLSSFNPLVFSRFPSHIFVPVLQMIWGQKIHHSAQRDRTQPLSLSPLSFGSFQREKKMVGSSSYVPEWLEGLLRERFFSPCFIHDGAKKNEKNIFCLDCCISICPHCLSPHRSHRLLQIRRYVYNDVIRVDDVEKLLDCSFVQSYITNHAKVMFLNQRPQTRPFRVSGNICNTCERSLQDSNLFCSVACKVENLVKKGTLPKYLYDCEFLPLPEGGKCEGSCYELEDGQMTPDSILESPASFSSASISSGGVGCRNLACTATTEVVRKKRTSISGGSRTTIRPACSPADEMVGYMNRRKGTPNRSPLY